MFSLYYAFSDNVPLFRCNFCGQCQLHIEAQNSLQINRGCCWYFPTYELADIKNLLDNGHEEFIGQLLAHPHTKIRRFELQVIGRFDQDAYQRAIAAASDLPQGDFDPSLHFKLCPFFGIDGCTISSALRPHPCNLYLCREVIQWSGSNYQSYNQERKDYFSYCAYVNESLRLELNEQGVDLISDQAQALATIRSCDIPHFEPRHLTPICLTVHEQP